MTPRLDDHVESWNLGRRTSKIFGFDDWSCEHRASLSTAVSIQLV